MKTTSDYIHKAAHLFTITAGFVLFAVWVFNISIFSQDSPRGILIFQAFTFLFLPFALFVVFKNNRQRKKEEETLQKRIRETPDYKYVLDESCIVAITNQWGIITHVNNNFCEISKYKREELIGQNHRIINSGFHSKELFRNLWSTINSGNIWRGDLRNRAKDGTIYWVDTTIVPFLNEKGKPYQFLAIRSDITERKKAEELLKEREESYRQIVETTHEGIWMIDHEGYTTFVNERMATMLNYSRKEMIGKHLFDFLNDEEKVNAAKNLQRREQGIAEDLEVRFITKDGLEICSILSTSPVEKNGKYTGALAMVTDITERKKAEKELSEQKLRQQKLITEITIQAQEKERNELGRELHDNINQILATVKMYLGMARSGQGIEEELIDKSHSYVNEAMEEIRKLTHSLVAPSLGDLGLKEALEELTKDTNFHNNLQIKLVVDKSYEEKRLDKNKKLMFYRIVQEQLGNIIKYAGATEVVISFRTDDDKFFLSVADNGVGFDSSQKGPGIGLKNISNRVEFYSGNMDIISSPGNGCILEVNIPY